MGLRTDMAPASARGLILTAVIALLSFSPALVDAAQIDLRVQGLPPGADLTHDIELGDELVVDVVIEAGSEEEITGFSLFISYDNEVFALMPAVEASDQETLQPFEPGGYLNGVPLLNRLEEVEGDTESFIAYAEASGVSREVATGSGVAARFRLEVLRRPLGDLSQIVVEERGHDRFSHYVTAATPGTERRFDQPGTLSFRVTGFRVKSLPDQVLVEGEASSVFILNDFVDQEGGRILWSATRLSELPTSIDEESTQVTITPQIGGFGSGPNRNASRRMIFTAFETGEGLTAADTIDIVVNARPQIGEAMRDTVRFAEDGSTTRDLDGFVADADDLNADLSWTATTSGNVMVSINPETRVATFTAAPDWYGNEEVVFRVADGDALDDVGTTVVSVAPVNDPPVAGRLEPVYPPSGSSGVAIPLSDLISDRDDELTDLEITPEVEGSATARISPDGTALIVSGDEAGRSVIRLTVTDTSGATAQTRQVAVVLGPNEQVAPEILSLPQVQLRAGTFTTLSLNPFARDDQPVSNLIWASVAPDELLDTIGSDNVLRVDADASFSGESVVVLVATDQAGLTDTATLPVQVAGEGQDLPPLISLPGKIGVVGEDESSTPTEVALDPLVIDLDDVDSQIQWEVFTSSPGLVINIDEDRTLMVSAGADFAQGGSGIGSISLIARNTKDLADTAAVPVIVSVPGQEPQMAPLPDVTLDSLAAEVRVDLDEFVFDADDFDSEVFMVTDHDPGVVVDVDPVTHEITVRRVEESGRPLPSTSVRVSAVDTDGGSSVTRILTIQLPPIFSLSAIPDIEFFEGEDASLDLDDHVAQPDPPPPLSWSVGPTQHLEVRIDPLTHRAFIEPSNADFVGSEVLTFDAMDETGRTRSGTVKVTVKSRGLAPEIRDLPTIELQAGGTDRSIDLDQFVFDDDPDDALRWTFTQPPSLEVFVDPATNEVTITAQEAAVGLEQVQFAVQDPAGNTDIGVLEVMVVRGGLPPQISGLPQITLLAGAPEQSLSLDLYVTDTDTPDDQIVWVVRSEPGVNARIQDRRLFLSVPAGQEGGRQLTLTATDPQGNEAEAVLQLTIELDAQAPRLSLEIKRNPVVADLIEVIVTSDESLPQAPGVRINGAEVEVLTLADDSLFVAATTISPSGELQLLEVLAEGADRAGNVSTRELTVALRWMIDEGGTVPYTDGVAIANVPDAAAGPRRLAILYRLGEEETPPESAGEPVYAIDLDSGEPVMDPYTINLFQGERSGQGRGLLRWEPSRQVWEEVPTIVDEAAGWLTASIRESGLYRPGAVASTNTRPTQKLANHPNPFPSAGSDNTQIEYEMSVAGPVRLEVFNVLGQRVRLLVDESFQDVGVWTVVWNGRDDAGRTLGSGVYFYELAEQQGVQCRSLVLFR